MRNVVWEKSSMHQPTVQKTSSITETQFILGRTQKIGGGVLTIGRYFALDGSLGAPVCLDVTRPHVIFICGKRGYGKSYTIGVFLEEICRLEEVVKKRLGVVVIDTLGIYWATRFPNRLEKDNLMLWGQSPQGLPVRLLVPSGAVEIYRKQRFDVSCFSLRVSRLSPAHWHQLFGLKPTDPVSVIITRMVLAMQATMDCYSIQDLLMYIRGDVRTSKEIATAVENFLVMAESWGIFDGKGMTISDLVQPGTISILDLSYLRTQGLKDIVVSLVGELIFEERVKARKSYEQKRIGLEVEESGLPLVWLAVDEAQLFIPRDHDTLSKDVLLAEWMRQGRQPGLSLIMATQRPSAVEPEVLAHSDLIMCHRLTAQEDIDMLGMIRPTYMRGDIAESIKKMGCEKGVALLVDDTSESVHVIKIRPRVSWHGGGEPVIDIIASEKSRSG
jgi:hypothetical protein